MFLPGAAALLGGAIASGQQATPTPVLPPPVNDTAIRTSFDQKVTALMEGGSTADIDALLEGLKTTKVPPGIRFTEPPAASEPTNDVDLLRRAREASLVFGRVFQCGKCDRWHGNYSGAVLIDPSGIVVTNYHVMNQKDSGAFGAMDSAGEVYPVTEILAASQRDDLAIVRIDKGDRKDDFPFVPLSAGDPTGTEVRVISHPAGNFYTLSEGIIARYFVHQKNGAERVQITADFARGSSGSGVFNRNGELTGIVVETSSLYYDQHEGVQQNLQMVVKSCAPVSSVRALFE